VPRPDEIPQHPPRQLGRGRLALRLSAEENEAMISPAANILGTLEGLLSDDLEPAFRKLVELDGHLTTAGSFANPVPE
jgi:hypothetical protein